MSCTKNKEETTVQFVHQSEIGTGGWDYCSMRFGLIGECISCWIELWCWLTILTWIYNINNRFQSLLITRTSFSDNNDGVHPDLKVKRITAASCAGKHVPYFPGKPAKKFTLHDFQHRRIAMLFTRHDLLSCNRESWSRWGVRTTWSLGDRGSHTLHNQPTAQDI